jgi:Protein of unknown function (DUF4245)
MTSPRRQPSVADLFRSLALVLGVTVVVALLLQWRHNDPVKVIDPTPAINEARRIAPYDVLVPVGLPDRWRPTSARLSAPQPEHRGVTHLHIGYVTPTTQYIAIEESDASAQAFISRETDHGEPRHRYYDGGRIWQSYVSPDGKTRSFTNTGQGRTVVLAGTASFGELEELASSLGGG